MPLFTEVRGIGILGSTAISAIIHDQGVGKGPSRLRPFGPYYACACIFERVSAHSNQQRGADKSRPSTEGGARMVVVQATWKRMVLLLVTTLVAVAMMAASAMPVFAAPRAPITPRIRQEL